MDVLSGRGERANTLEPTINSPQLARKNNKYMAWLPMASVPQFLEKTQTYLAGHLISKGAYNAPLRLFWRATSLMVREYPDRPLVGVGAVIVEHDRVLLIKRGKAPLLGEWSIPGGLLELGETARQGAEREVLEETGLVIRATELLGVFDRLVPDDDKRTRYHYLLVDFLCVNISGELQASGDAADARWFTQEEVSGLTLPEDTAAVIGKAFTKRQN